MNEMPEEFLYVLVDRASDGRIYVLNFVAREMWGPDETMASVFHANQEEKEDGTYLVYCLPPDQIPELAMEMLRVCSGNCTQGGMLEGLKDAVGELLGVGIKMANLEPMVLEE